MKTKPHRKQAGFRRPPKRPIKRVRGFKGEIVSVFRPSPVDLRGGVDDEDALVIAESLDEREKRG